MSYLLICIPMSSLWPWRAIRHDENTYRPRGCHIGATWVRRACNFEVNPFVVIARESTLGCRGDIRLYWDRHRSEHVMMSWLRTDDHREVSSERDKR